MAGQIFNGIDELQAFVVHQEPDRRSMRPTTEAMIELLLRTNGKGRGFLVVERAAGLKFTTGPFQGDPPFNQFYDISTAQQFFNK
jgi:hypothetical protein